VGRIRLPLVLNFLSRSCHSHAEYPSSTRVHRGGSYRRP